MHVIPPVSITPAMITACSIAEPDTGETAWNAATSYTVGTQVIRTTTHKKYECLVAGVDAGLPENTPARWLDVGSTNKYAMFELTRNTVSTAISQLSFSVQPGVRINSLGLLGLKGNTVTYGLRAGSYTNMLPYSEDFSNASWAKFRCSITANTTAVPAPSGLYTADKIVEDTTASNTHAIMGPNISVTSGLPYTFSIYVKAAERSYCILEISGTPMGTVAFFNLITGTVSGYYSNVNGSRVYANIQTLSDGWYKLSVTKVAASTGNIQCNFYINNTVNNVSYTGDGASGLYIWGAQLNQAILSDPNLLTFSEQFENAAWIKSNVGITGNSTVAPDGSTTADTITVTTTSNPYLYQNYTSTNGTTYCLSFYIKATATSNVAKIELYNNGVGPPTFVDYGILSGPGTISNGTASANIAGLSLTTWTRVYLVATAIGTSLAAGIKPQGSGGGSSIGDALVVWGAQLEQGTIPTDYIKTTAPDPYVATTTVAATAQGIVHGPITTSISLRRTISWSSYFFGTFNSLASFLTMSIPPFTGGTLDVVINGGTGNAVQCGAVATGTAIYLGKTQNNAKNDALNFSTITRDTFGNATLVARRSVPKLTQQVVLEKEYINTAIDVRKSLNAVPALWTGFDDRVTDDYFEALLIMGIYKQFEIDLANPIAVYINLELEEI